MIENMSADGPDPQYVAFLHFYFHEYVERNNSWKYRTWLCFQQTLLQEALCYKNEQVCIGKPNFYQGHQCAKKKKITSSEQRAICIFLPCKCMGPSAVELIVGTCFPCN